jgi:hypothetical protein
MGQGAHPAAHRPDQKITRPKPEEPQQTIPGKKSAVLKLLKKISAPQNPIFKPADLHDFHIAADTGHISLSCNAVKCHF